MLPGAKLSSDRRTTGLASQFDSETRRAIHHLVQETCGPFLHVPATQPGLPQTRESPFCTSPYHHEVEVQPQIAFHNCQQYSEQTHLLQRSPPWKIQASPETQ